MSETGESPEIMEALLRLNYLERMLSILSSMAVGDAKNASGLIQAELSLLSFSLSEINFHDKEKIAVLINSAAIRAKKIQSQLGEM